jgi:hypothetical protein
LTLSIGKRSLGIERVTMRSGWQRCKPVRRVDGRLRFPFDGAGAHS